MEPGGGALGGVDAGARHVLDPDDVPPVLARADDGEAARLAQAVDELLDEPAAGPVDVAGPDDHVLERGLAQQALALLLGAPVFGLDRQLRLLVEHRALRVAGDHGRGEDDPADAGGLAGGDQGAGAVDVDLPDLRRVALRGDLGGEVDDALGRGGLDRAASDSASVRSPATGAVPGGSEPARLTRALTSWPRPSSSAQTTWPRKPLAPVTRTFTRRVYAEAD